MDEGAPRPDNGRIRPDGYEVLDAYGRRIEPEKPRRRGLGRTPVSMAVLVVCVAVYVVFNLVLNGAQVFLTFSPANGLLFPGILTSIFAHADFLHLLFNMVILYVLGTIVEIRYGPARYALLFFVSALFASLAQAAVEPAGYQLGASGALAGVMAAFVRHNPRVMLYIWGIVPIPAWLAAALWLLYNVVGAGLGEASVAFVAHLAGFAAGGALSFLLIPLGGPPAAHGKRG